MDVRIYTDGGSRGNPGPSASAAVLKSLKDGSEGEVIATASAYLGTTTNNQAEYTAIVLGLKKAAELGAKHVEVFMDSELASRQLNGEYRVKDAEIAKRFMEIYRLRGQFTRVRFKHVRRHMNKEADALVNKVLDAHT
ncbi:ribonuclease HI family protein [Candidatus Uhrbacteria bacterium]|nr:ribonuclease HI family protein [Candidatus Uhrbacteria bacterium]